MGNIFDMIMGMYYIDRTTGMCYIDITIGNVFDTIMKRITSFQHSNDLEYVIVDMSMIFLFLIYPF